MKSSKLVLLFGLPRSGTTWIGKLFDSHLDTNYLHEPDSVDPNSKIPLLVLPKSNSQTALKKSIKSWLKPTDEKVIASRPFFKKSYLNAFQWFSFLCSAYVCKISCKLHLPFFKKPISNHYNAPFTVWKSIESLGRISAIADITKAKAIQIIRHPCGEIASTLRGESAHQFDGNLKTCEDWDLFEKLLVQSGEKRFSLADIKAMKQEERLAIRWGIINDFALNNQINGQSLVLIYEDLCRHPKEKITEVFNNIGLAISQETLDYIGDSTDGDDEAYYATRKTILGKLGHKRKIDPR